MMRRMWAGGLLCLLSMACAETRPSGYLSYTVEMKEPDGSWVSHGYGCMAVGDGSAGTSESAGGSTGEDFSVTLETVGAVAEFTVEVNGREIEHRVFEQAFLRGNKEETVSFTLPSGEQRYHFRSGSSCDQLVFDAG